MIAIVDYGLGNIKAFANIFHRLDLPYAIANTPDTLKKASKIILPGVGAFDYAMKLLSDSGLRDTLDTLVLEKSVPVLGICVGMQIMGDSSEEGQSKGLGWIKGRVKKFPSSTLPLSEEASLSTYPLPHMGWNTISFTQDHPLLNGLTDQSRFYFLHSYYFDCENSHNVLTQTDYGMGFHSAIYNNAVMGVQFHPEKSHKNGVNLLKNFGDL